MTVHAPPSMVVRQAPLSLADVVLTLANLPGLSPSRRRDLISCVRGVARLCDDEPGAIALDFDAIRKKLDAITPVGRGISEKRLANIRWGFGRAIRATRLAPVQSTRTPLTAGWTNLMTQLRDQRSIIGLTRLAHFASGRDVGPDAVDDGLIDELMDHGRRTSLRKKQECLRRTTILVWNEVARAFPDLGLRALTVPPKRHNLTRIKTDTLPESFRRDEQSYVDWCTGADAFAAGARSRRLAPGTVRNLRGYINAAATALVATGVNSASLKTLGDLVTPEALRRTLRQRSKVTGSVENRYSFYMAQALCRIAKDWIKVDDDVISELRRLAKVARPTALGWMTPKNRSLIRPFHDLDVVRRLHELPQRLWREMGQVRRSRRSLAMAHAALAIAILTYMPIRLQNLVALEFDRHIFLYKGSDSILEIPGVEVKNGRPLKFVIPPRVVGMLESYRDTVAPQVIGRRPTRLFVNRDGSPKCAATVRYLIQTYMLQRVGVRFSPHTFRHLSGMLILKAFPGGHGIVRDLLGHSSLKTTSEFYLDDNSVAAGLDHQLALDDSIAADRRKRRQKSAGW